jgi:hypothetical protein
LVLQLKFQADVSWEALFAASHHNDLERTAGTYLNGRRMYETKRTAGERNKPQPSISRENITESVE